MPDELATAISEQALATQDPISAAGSRMIKGEQPKPDADPTAEEPEEDPNAEPEVFNPEPIDAPSDPLAVPEGEELGEEETTDEPVEEEKPKAKLFTVEVPTPHQEGTEFTDPVTGERTTRPPKGAGVLQIPNLTQEAADTLRFHLKRSEKLPKLEERLAQENEDTATVDFIRQRPEEAIHLITAKQPAIAEGFAVNWMRRNPDAALKALRTLELLPADAIDMLDQAERELDPKAKRNRKLEADAAQREADDKVKEGIRGVQLSVAERRFADRSVESIQDIASTLKLQGEDLKDFVHLASSKLQDAFAGNPSMSPTQMTALLQPIVRRFASIPQKPDPTPDPAALMKRKADLANKHKRLGSGRSPIAPAGVVKLKPGATLDDASAALRAAR